MTPEECGSCDGFGIATFYGGPGNSFIAPCLVCSPGRNLRDLERDKVHAFERPLIEEHNARMNAPSTSGDE